MYIIDAHGRRADVHIAALRGAATPRSDFRRRLSGRPGPAASWPRRAFATETYGAMRAREAAA